MRDDYKFVSESGPDHDKSFTMGVFLGNEKIGEGSGSSKQKAEVEAAKVGLKVKKWENISIAIEQSKD